MFRVTNERGRPVTVISLIAVLVAMCMTAGMFTCEVSYAALSTKKQWGKDITDAKLNKYNGKSYYWKLPGVNQFACTGYTEWALNSVYGVKVPGYASTRALREYFIKKGNKIVAYGRHVGKAQGGNGKYYAYGEIKPGDIVFFFRRKTGKNGKITKSPIGSSRGYLKTSGWAHVAVIGGSVSGSHGISSKLHHNNHVSGIHYGGTIKKQITKYSAEKGATDYQVMRVIEPEAVKRPVRVRKSMKVNGNVLPEGKAVFRIWPQKYGKYSSKSSWWKKIPGEYKDTVTTDKDGNAVTKKLPTASDDFSGKYYIYQTKGPADVRRAKNKAITLKKGTSTVEWKYTDESTEHPSIVKMDAVSEEPVTQSGIRFRLKRKGAFSKLREYLASAGEKSAESDDAGSDGAENDDDPECDPDEVVKAFLSDDPESELEGLGISIEDAGWVSVGGKDEFVTDGSGEAEVTTVKKEDIGEYEVYEVSSPEGYKLPGYAIAAADPDAASDLDVPVDMTIGSVASTVSVKLFNMPEPEIGTEAVDDNTGDHYGASVKNAGITDTVYTSNLEKGKTYTLSGRLVFKDNGEPVQDSSGKAITSVMAFDVEEDDETIIMDFSFDGRLLQGREAVVFEKLYEGDFDDEPEGVEPLAVHEDPGDKDQTVSYPDGHTSAKDHETGTRIGAAVKSAQIDDIFYYHNLKPGAEYELTGTLYDKDTGKEVRSGGKVVTSEVVFTAQETNGEVPVSFSFDASGMDGDELVACEVLKLNGKTILTHKNLNDESQTVRYPEKTDEPEEPEKQKPEEPDKPSEKDGGKPSEHRYTNGPKTGDDQMELLVLLITVLICAIVILAIMAVTYRDKNIQKIKKKGMR